jgi:FkbM family methyltransferase
MSKARRLAMKNQYVCAGLRYLRGRVFHLLGRDPLNGALGYRGELAAVRTVQAVRLNPPAVIEENEGFKLWRTSVGDYWMPAKGTELFISDLITEASLNVYRFQSSNIVIDCGGNIGTFCRPAVAGGAKLVIAFEPDPDNIQCFRRNLQEELRTGRVVLIEKGVWNQADKLWLTSKPSAHPGSSTISMTPAESGLYVDVTTIDTVVADMQLTAVDFLKMDIEGAEVRALQGARRTIEQFRPRIGLGTEHTDDIYDNNLRVLETVRSICPDYQCEVTEVHATRSPQHGWMLTPHSIALHVPGPEFYFTARSR